MSTKSITSLFFVASPLHYLAARAVARQFEADSRCLLVCYRDKVEKAVDPAEWDRVVYAPWQRFDPLPGRFGSHRRLLDNLRKVAAVVGRSDELRLHSPIFDTEAVNYFLRGLPRLCGARHMHARILPDGLLNIQRYPLSLPKRIGLFALFAGCFLPPRPIQDPRTYSSAVVAAGLRTTSRSAQRAVAVTSKRPIAQSRFPTVVANSIPEIWQNKTAS